MKIYKQGVIMSSLKRQSDSVRLSVPSLNALQGLNQKLRKKIND